MREIIACFILQGMTQKREENWLPIGEKGAVGGVFLNM